MKIPVSALLLTFANLIAQNTTFTTQEIEVNPLIKGTLFTPSNSGNNHLVILIAGSGPTNRSGNQIGMINNSLKYLSESMASNGISVYSYDKRLFALLSKPDFKEEDSNFDDVVKDAVDVIEHFRKEGKYKKIVIAGHSEGSLIGMIAAKDRADGFISLAGAGRPADEIIQTQIGKQAPFLKDKVKEKFELLKKGQTFKLEEPMLESLFRESVQPYLMSWIKYDPKIEIVKLKMPVLIVNGTNDIQVAVSEAELLHGAKPEAKISIIPKMNHIFREIDGDDTANFATYSNKDLPISTALTSVVNQFIKSI